MKNAKPIKREFYIAALRDKEGLSIILLSLRGVSESRRSEGNSKESQCLQNSKTPSSESNINSASLHVKNFDQSRKMAERVKRVISGYGQGDKDAQGTGGGFGYYELGEPLMNGDVLNENLPVEKIREYVWHTETRGTGNVQQVADVGSDPYLLGVVDETAYYFCYEKAKKVTLNRALLRRLKTKAERYVIYADICLIEAVELKKMNIVFKKIPRDITRL